MRIGVGPGLGLGVVFAIGMFSVGEARASGNIKKASVELKASTQDFLEAAKDAGEGALVKPARKLKKAIKLLSHSQGALPLVGQRFRALRKAWGKSDHLHSDYALASAWQSLETAYVSLHYYLNEDDIAEAGDAFAAQATRFSKAVAGNFGLGTLPFEAMALIAISGQFAQAVGSLSVAQVLERFTAVEYVMDVITQKVEQGVSKQKIVAAHAKLADAYDTLRAELLDEPSHGGGSGGNCGGFGGGFDFEFEEGCDGSSDDDQDSDEDEDNDWDEDDNDDGNDDSEDGDFDWVL